MYCLTIQSVRLSTGVSRLSFFIVKYGLLLVALVAMVMAVTSARLAAVRHS